jgi:hypothetical protein
MNDRQKLIQTLQFQNVEEGAVLETFFPWTKTIDHWLKEGLSREFCSQNLYPLPAERYRRYFNDCMTEPVYSYEQHMGFDGVKRMAFRIPYNCFKEKTIHITEEYKEKIDEDGWHRKYYKNRFLVEAIKPAVSDMEDWKMLKRQVADEIDKWCTNDKLLEVYGKYIEGHNKGDFSIRFRVSGFFWTPRMLLGDEKHLLAHYDSPELLHDIARFTVEVYKQILPKIGRLIEPDVILFEEDLSGKNGPMISPKHFQEFVGTYYQELIPLLKENGFLNFFVDTDGDFIELIESFTASGIDGFLPMDVNSGIDIVAVRKRYPKIKIIGGFNKLKIDEGKDAIDLEFDRLKPVIRQGGYVTGCDHQVAPTASLENYLYYIDRLRSSMKQAGRDTK